LVLVLTEIAYSVRITEKANQVNVEIGTRCAHNGLGGNVPIFGGFDCDLSDRQIFLLLRDFQNMLSFGGRALEMPIFEGKYDFLATFRRKIDVLGRVIKGALQRKTRRG
jgi:hypothetical protein